MNGVCGKWTAAIAEVRLFFGDERLAFGATGGGSRAMTRSFAGARGGILFYQSSNDVMLR